MIAGDQAYSTLEIVSQPTRIESEQWKYLSTDPGKQVIVDGGKQFVGDNVGLELALKEDFDTHKVHVHPVLPQRLLARRRIILYGTVGLTLILGAVLGGVLGSRSKTSAASSSVTPIQRNIAAVSFTSNSANITQVYFQDDVGQIIEASNSQDNMTWTINKTGIGGKKGSVIAAAVSRPSLPLEISIFYLDVNNLIHDIIYTGSTGKWTSGTLSAKGYTTMANSSLSAIYNWCRLCANTTIIAFQDEKGFVKIGSFTSDGWTLEQLGQALNPSFGTGLALQPYYLSGLADQINLYYQKSVLSMALASWKPGSANQGDNGWSLNERIYDPIPSGSPIAAASSYSTVSNGHATWFEVLSLSTTGVEVDSWSGAISGWLAHHVHPPAMTNSSNNVKIYDSVAVTATGNAFGVVKQDGRADAIENWQVADDMLDWSSVGNVNLNGAWE